MARLAKSVNVVNLGTSNAAAPTILVASSTVTRVLRGFTFVNNNASSIAWNFGWGTAAIMTAANSQWFGITLPTQNTFVHNFPGFGARLNTPATDVIMAFASLANVSLTIDYDEYDLT